MSLRNTANGYGWAAIVMHWLIAASVAFLFGSGLYMADLSYLDPMYVSLPALHVSIGISLSCLLALRIISRGFDRRPRAHGSSLQRRVARWAHWLLDALTATVILSGYVFSSMDGREIEVFTWFRVPAMPWALGEQDMAAGLIHDVCSWALIGLALGHALAACKYQFIDRDATLARMLRPTCIEYDKT